MATARPAPRRATFYLAVALQALFLLAMAGFHLFTLRTGERVLLKTQPVDPRDLFRGDYVRLSYEISELDAAKLAPPGASFQRGDAVWVLLERGQPHWQAVRVSTERPVPVADQVAVRARVRYHHTLAPREERPADRAPDRPGPPPPPRPAAALGLAYGIESFFVPEGQGRALENRPDRRINLEVEAAVDRFGNAAIARVLLDGQEVRFE